MPGLLLCLCGEPAGAQAPPRFVDATSVIPDLVVDMRYAGRDNFVGAPIDGYEAPRCLLTREAAEALAAAQRELATSGLGLKVFDCYRPARAVAHFVRWARDPNDQAQKAKFYPTIPKSELFRRGYIGRNSAHSGGSTVDLTLVRSDSKAELPMGSAFDTFAPVSGLAAPGVPWSEKVNRATLRSVMSKAGFAPYDAEWWHFSLRKEPYPRTAFDVPVK